MAQFASDPAFVAAHLAPAKFDFHAKEGKIVSFPAATGAPASAFYVPPSPGNHVGIVMCHEFWGLNGFIKQAAEKLHDDTGYAVLAVDLYDGKVTDDAQQASKWMAAFDNERGYAIVTGAIKALRDGDLGFKAKKIGTLGYCFGGGWSERTAVVGSTKVQACVVYYGMPDDRPQSIDRLKAPVMFFRGTQDGWITEKVVDSFADLLKAKGKRIEVHAYDAPHAFANPSNPKYNAAAAADAYSRELAFYKKYLGK